MDYNASMRKRGFDSYRARSGRTIRVRLGLLVAVLTLVRAAYSQEILGEAITFGLSGSTCRISVRSRAVGTAVYLEKDGNETLVSPEGGENLFPVVQVAGDHFFILWTRYADGIATLGLYDSRKGGGRIIPLEGLKFIGSPFFLEDPSSPNAIVFLGNASNNDDVFYFDLTGGRLINLTHSPESEKGFTVETVSGAVKITAKTLWERISLRLDPWTLAFRETRRTALGKISLLPATIRSTGNEEAVKIANTYIAFGDSITWGKMRMDNLEGEYHPELAYPQKMVAALEPIYGTAYPVNLGVSGESTYGGALRVESELAATAGAYFLLMEGTNDVISGEFSVDSSIENLNFLISTALGRDMRVILSTIPPRKDSLGLNPVIHENILLLNARISELAESLGIGFIDTFGAFMATDFPDGWKTLLEDTVGNHPSPAGHLIIADLFAKVLAAFPPHAPSGVKKSITTRPAFWKVEWDPCLESDFACYRLEYGPSETAMTEVVILTSNFHVFQQFVSRKIWFRLQAVDAAGNRSDFTGTRVTTERSRDEGTPGRHAGEIVRRGR
jgi:lysophospholipase L1-like esterase